MLRDEILSVNEMSQKKNMFEYGPLSKATLIEDAQLPHLIARGQRHMEHQPLGCNTNDSKYPG